MPRYGLPNPTKPVTSLSKGSRQDIKLTNPASSKSGFAASSKPPKVTPDYGYVPHKMGAKTLKGKSPSKTVMGK
jgi:hypothetical protein